MQSFNQFLTSFRNHAIQPGLASCPQYGLQEHRSVSALLTHTSATFSVKMILNVYPTRSLALKFNLLDCSVSRYIVQVFMYIVSWPCTIFRVAN